MKQVPQYKASKLEVLKKLKSDQEELYRDVNRQVGNIAKISLFNHNIYVIFDKEWVKQICFDKRLKYEKGLKELELIIERGLITTNNYEEWKLDRTALNPLFADEKLKEYAKIMQANIESTISNWKKMTEQNKAINLDHEMTSLVFQNLLSTLFSNAPVDIPHFSDLVRTSLLFLKEQAASLLKLEWRLPTRRGLQLKNKLKKIKNIGDDVVRFCLQSEDEVNLVKILGSAYPKKGDQKGLSLNLRQEVLTFLVAGHETTASTLSRLWIILAQYPLYLEKLREEISKVVNGRPLASEDLSSLRYLRACILETLRLYPPIAVIVRYLNEDDEIDGYSLKKGSHFIIPIKFIHHHKDYWENPEAFLPERFLMKLDDKYNFIYLPFGAGPRMCIGKSFAMMEMMIIAVSLLQEFDFELASYIKHKDSGPIIVRPDSLLEMRVKPRQK